MRVAFLLSVLLAAGLLGLLERYWRPLAWRLGKGYRLLRPALSLLSLGIFAKIASGRGLRCSGRSRPCTATASPADMRWRRRRSTAPSRS
jgi:hypothetical protein